MTLPFSRLSLVAAGAALATALAAPAAQAEMFAFGSDLTAPANVTEARQADTAYWQTTFASGASPLAPATGQIRSVRVKGTALADPKPGVVGGETMWHLQALRARSDGTFQILRSSGAFFMPTTGDPQQITSFAPDNFCIDKGDILVFNTVGGWDGVPTQTGPYPHGTPLQIFSRGAGGSVSQFTGADKTNNGDILTADHARGAGQELLMQLSVGTAADATALCPGGLIGAWPKPGPAAAPVAPKPPAPQKVTIPKQRVTVSRTGKLTVALFCLPGRAPCSGAVQVRSTHKVPKRLAGRSYRIAAKSTGKVSLRLSPSARRAFVRSGRRLRVKIVTETKPGGPERIVSSAFTLRKRGG